jgi:hypothetical protein
LDKLPMALSVELGIFSSPFFKFPVYITPYVCGFIHEDAGCPFFHPAWSIQLFCGWSSCGCLAVFPRLKGKKHSSLFFLWLSGDVDSKSLHSMARYRVRLLLS